MKITELTSLGELQMEMARLAVATITATGTSPNLSVVVATHFGMAFQGHGRTWAEAIDDAFAKWRDGAITPGYGNPVARIKELEDKLLESDSRGDRLARELNAGDRNNDRVVQDSPELKAEWLVEVQRKLPISSKVRVIASDIPFYIGATGTVIGHDVGDRGEWPLVRVEFDPPIAYGRDHPWRDSFYEEDIAVIPDGNDPATGA